MSSPAEGRTSASERAKRVSEPTVGMFFVMIISATGDVSERAKRVSEPHSLSCCHHDSPEGERSEPFRFINS